MILYFANRKMEIIGHASTAMRKGFVIVDDEKTEEIDTGVATFSCTIAYDTAQNRNQLEAMTEAGNYILRNNGNEQEFYTILDAEIDTKSKEIYVYAEDAGLDLLNEIVGEYKATEAHTAEWYVNYFLGDSGFEVGKNEIPEDSTRTLSWEGEATIVERLASIANSFGGFEISYSFVIKGMQVTKKLVNIYQQRGKDVGEILMQNRDIDRIVTKKSVANLATALLVTGGTYSDGETVVTLEGFPYDDGDFYVDGLYLKSRKAVQKWGRYILKGSTHEGHIVRLYSYDTLSQSELCSRAITELKKICDKETLYEVDINRLPDNAKIGDRVNIVDDESNLYISARILILKTSETARKVTATLGEYLTRTSGLSARVEELAAKLSSVKEQTAEDINNLIMQLIGQANDYITVETNDGISGFVSCELDGETTDGTNPDYYLTVDTAAVLGVATVGNLILGG